MHPVLELLQSSRRYRVLALTFILLDLLAIAAATVGWRSWIHAGGAVLQSIAWVLVLYPLCLPPLQPNRSSVHPHSAANARVTIGVVLLFFAGWAVVGLLDESVKGYYADYVLEAIVFVAWLAIMGGLLVERGWKMRRPSTGQTPT